MKTIVPISALLFASIALVQSAASQTPAPAKPHPAPAAKSAAPSARSAAPAPAGCVKLPALSPKIPALPPGSPCAKPLYTIISNPPFKLTDISPMEDPGLAEALHIQSPETITLSYIDTKIGTGALIVPRKWYTIKYTGYLVDGTKFDSSDNHPENGGTFSFLQGPQDANGQRMVVLGMDTGLDGMRVGGKRRLIIPWELAYGHRPPQHPRKVRSHLRRRTRQTERLRPIPQAASSSRLCPSFLKRSGRPSIDDCPAAARRA